MAAITDLATLTSVASVDWLPIHDLSAGTDKKISQSDLLGPTSTWTPTLRFGGGTTGITYTTQSGNYSLVGNLVFVECRIVLSSKGSSSGSATIGGLPYSNAVTSTPMSVFVSLMGTSIIAMNALALSTATINLYVATAAFTAWTVAADTHFGNTTQLWVSGVYQV